MNVDNVKTKIEKAFEENPVAVIGVGATAAMAAAKLLNAVTEHRNSKTWKKEVERRRMKS